MEQLSSHFTYLPIISRPAEEPVPWGGLTGYVQELWGGRRIEREWGFPPTPGDTRVFLCGNPAMIEDMVALLADEGFREHSRKEAGHVFVERYW